MLLFPDPLPAGMDLQTHDYQNSRWFFALAALLPLIPVFATQIPLKDIAMKLLAPLVGI